MPETFSFEEIEVTAATVPDGYPPFPTADYFPTGIVERDGRRYAAGSGEIIDDIFLQGLREFDTISRAYEVL